MKYSNTHIAARCRFSIFVRTQITNKIFTLILSRFKTTLMIFFKFFIVKYFPRYVSPRMDQIGFSIQFSRYRGHARFDCLKWMPSVVNIIRNNHFFFFSSSNREYSTTTTKKKKVSCNIRTLRVIVSLGNWRGPFDKYVRFSFPPFEKKKNRSALTAPPFIIIIIICINTYAQKYDVSCAKSQIARK